jgi:hypothetical protein
LGTQPDIFGKIGVTIGGGGGFQTDAAIDPVNRLY